jgi:hypothetical protein
MLLNMSPAKTAGNAPETDSDLAALVEKIAAKQDQLLHRIDHVDEGVHELLRILAPIADNPEALAKAVGLMGRKLPAWMGGKHG